MAATFAPSIFGTGALAAHLVPLLSNPITAIVAGGLLVGSLLLGRSKQRKGDEQLRDQLRDNAFGQLNELIRQVQRNRLDGESAIAQAVALRAQYVTQINSIRTKSVRESALRNQLPGLAV